MYQFNQKQEQTQGQRLKNVDLRLVVGYLKSVIRFVIAHPGGPRPFVVEGFRTFEQQTENYAKGRTTPGPKVTEKKPGHSKHEQTPAQALDIGFLDENGQPVYSPGNYLEFYGYWKEHSPTIIWGGLWKTLVDRPHFEVDPLL